MKRQSVHAGFAALAACGAVFLTTQVHELRRANRVNEAVAQVSTAQTEMPQVEHPQVRLAEANMLSSSGKFSEAEKRYSQLIREHRTDATGQAAQYNLANGYLRTSLQSDVDKGSVLPLVELAKQRYRDLLQLTPTDWDARYNLERALRLAPEFTDGSEGNGADPIKRVRVIVPDFETRDLP
ncbi:MAG: hypothetical protein V3U76_06285 [Granulosicoccus sp.]